MPKPEISDEEKLLILKGYRKVSPQELRAGAISQEELRRNATALTDRPQK